MGRKRFPLIKNVGCYPKTHRCPMCGRNMTGNFALLAGGAMFGTRDTQSMDDRLFGFLDLSIHDDSNEVYVNTRVAGNSSNGQFEIYACSLACLMRLINEAYTDLAVKYSKEVKKRKKHA